MAPAQPQFAPFQPTGAALLDPKAYFAQLMSAPQAGLPLVAATAAPMQGAPTEKTEIHTQVEAASAVKCATIVKEKGQNFTTQVALAALNTMATKSSFKLREELFKQPAVRNLCKRIRGILVKPPAGLPIEDLSQAAWAISRFPDEALGDASSTLMPTANALASELTKGGLHIAKSLPADTMVRVLWCLASGNVVVPRHELVSQVVADLLRDGGRRIKELSHECLANVLWALSKARQHKKEGDLRMVRLEQPDEELFALAAARVEEQLESFDVKLLAELAHYHADVGIRNERLFKAMCPKLCAKQKDVKQESMARAIKAYARFMIPLKEEAQGFRTMAVVCKGDFIRPSDKPGKRGPKHYDKPQSLYESTQLHSRG